MLIRSERAFRNAAQASALAAVVTVVIALVVTTQQNLAQQGISSGFGFLERSTGWDIPFTLIEYSARDTYARVLLVGFLNTIFVGLFGLFFATVLGTLVGIARIASNPLLNLLGTVYVEVFRNIPLLLQGFFWYAIATHLPPPRRALEYADAVFLSSRGLYVPSINIPGTALLLYLALLAVLLVLAFVVHRQLVTHGVLSAARLVGMGLGVALVVTTAGLFLLAHTPGTPLVNLPELKGLRFVGGLRVIPEFTALAVAIIVFGAAYIGEIVRGGFMSVSKGQLECARALGLHPWVIMWKVHIPLALRAIVPPLGNQYVWLMKATTIGIAIGFSDLFMIVSTSINQSGQTIELLGILMGGFFVINYTISTLMNLLNKAIALKGYESLNRSDGPQP